MEIAKSYQAYLTIARLNLTPEELASTEEIAATPQEIAWQKGFQFVRAMGHARAGHATPEELGYLAHRGYYYPTTPLALVKPAPLNASVF